MNTSVFLCYNIRMALRFRSRVNKDMDRHQGDERWQHEMKEMQETQDLRKVDDDVEDASTLFEWHAPDHTHMPKSPKWFAILAAGIAVLAIIFLLSANFIAVITTVLVGGLIYYVAQVKPTVVRYRLMVDGVAIGTTLYHYRDLQAFNIIYEPGAVKTVLIRSKRRLAPLVHMEIGDANPVAIRDILLEFIEEDLEMDEPLVDVWARKLGF